MWRESAQAEVRAFGVVVTHESIERFGSLAI